MTRQQLWEIYVKKNPQFAEEGATVTMSVRGLKKLFEQTWDIAEEQGKTRRTVAEKFEEMFKKFKM